MDKKITIVSLEQLQERQLQKEEQEERSSSDESWDPASVGSFDEWPAEIELDFTLDCIPGFGEDLGDDSPSDNEAE